MTFYPFLTQGDLKWPRGHIFQQSAYKAEVPVVTSDESYVLKVILKQIRPTKLYSTFRWFDVNFDSNIPVIAEK